MGFFTRFFDSVDPEVQKILSKLDGQELPDNLYLFLSHPRDYQILDFDQEVEDGWLRTTVSAGIRGFHLTVASIQVILTAEKMLLPQQEYTHLWGKVLKYKYSEGYPTDAVNENYKESRATVEYIRAWLDRRLIPHYERKHHREELEQKLIQERAEQFQKKYGP